MQSDTIRLYVLACHAACTPMVFSSSQQGVFPPVVLRFVVEQVVFVVQEKSPRQMHI